MQNAAPKAIAIQRVIEALMRKERGRLIAGLIARLGDFQLAEDALQEAAISALKHWGRSGLPDNPVAWLMRAGLNKGIDEIRARARDQKKADAILPFMDDVSDPVLPEAIPDERLRLIFTCCHPALEEKSRVALTLRTVCNLTTREIAAAFIDHEHTMGQRLSRAKAKIKAKGISFSEPPPELWNERLSTVLSTLYLIYTTGYVNEDETARDLCKEGVFLARLLLKLRQGEPEIEGVLALMLLTEARQRARIDEEGAIVPVERQDDTLWQNAEISEAHALLEHAMQRKKPGPFQIKAAIADCHMMRPRPDWVQMARLYEALWRYEPTPIIALNWAVVLSETNGVEFALTRLDALKASLETYQPWHAARAHFLEKLTRIDEAKQAYEKAIEMAPSVASRRYLGRRLAML